VEGFDGYLRADSGSYGVIYRTDTDVDLLANLSERDVLAG